MNEILDKESMERRFKGLIRASCVSRRGRGSDNLFEKELSLIDCMIESPSAAFEILVDKTGISFGDIRRLMRKWRLNNPAFREEFVAQVQEGALLLREFLCRETVDLSVYDSLRRMVFSNPQPFCSAGVLLRKTVEISSHPYTDQIKNIFDRLNWRNSQYFLRNLMDIIAEERGFKEKKHRSGRSDGSSMSDLESRVVDLTSSLEVTQQQLESLEEELSSVREEAGRDAAVDFFRELNAPHWGGLLDQLYLAEGRVSEIRSGAGIPPELESVATTVRMVVRFLRKSGLREVVPVGTELSLSLSDLDEYVYEGSQFSDGEVKRVHVISPGWIYKDERVSRPSVREGISD